MNSLKNTLWGWGLKILKRWSRSGLLNYVDQQANFRQGQVVLSVGGHGPVDSHIKRRVEQAGGTFVTLDIAENHVPDILGDIVDLSAILKLKNLKPDLIIALEVLEHVPNFRAALNECQKSLSEKGVLILSTPWIIPIHDRPNDFYRFTPGALELALSEFRMIDVRARGNYYDSVVMLLLRGLFSGGNVGKLIFLVGAILSLISRNPEIHKRLKSTDSCIGYVTVAYC